MTELLDPATEETSRTFFRWSERYPEIGTGPISTDRFFSAERYQQERTHIFSKMWLNVGSVHDLEGPGSYFTRDIAVLGVALLVTQEGNEIRGFHNVCTHRANKLVWEGRGTCPAGQIACRFHGWGYTLDGSLKTVTDEECFDFGPGGQQQLGLVPIRTEVWKGLIFINLDREGTDSLLDHLGELATELEQVSLDDWGLFHRADVSERANWKVALDAQNEIYHIPILAPMHRFAGSGMFDGTDGGYTRLHEFARLGPHTVYTSVPSGEFIDTSSARALTESNPEWYKRAFPVRGNAAFAFHVVFPNLVLMFQGAMLVTYNFWPEAPDRVTWEMRFHFPKPKTLLDSVSNEHGRIRQRDLLSEDKLGHEALQIGLESRSRPVWYPGEQEVQIRSFHHNVDSYIEQGNADA
jgi:phenylpropionate dioxygenase-like ring-hydroxylating dioxygenase large terminal subunit